MVLLLHICYKKYISVFLQIMYKFYGSRQYRLCLKKFF